MHISRSAAERRGTRTVHLAALMIFMGVLGACSQREPGKLPESEQRMERPIIGINTSIDENGGRDSVSTRVTYVDAIVKAGGLPLLLPAIEDEAAISDYVALCDGLVFIGGGDISPERYGRSRHPMENPLSARRENFDFALIEKTLAEQKPFLAICLGCQEVNVALGGTLIQDIASQTDSKIRHSTRQPGEIVRHKVRILEDSLLFRIVGRKEIESNSSHHQAIERPGNGLRVVAQTEDGIVEALELENYPFGLGIQWHPEALVTEEEHFAIFKAFVEAAEQARRERGR